MSSRSRRRGTAFEVRVLRLLRAAGLEADRQPLRGTRDSGDLVCRLPDGRRLLLECRHHRGGYRLADLEVKTFRMQRASAGTGDAVAVVLGLPATPTRRAVTLTPAPRTALVGLRAGVAVRWRDLVALLEIHERAVRARGGHPARPLLAGRATTWWAERLENAIGRWADET